jgi:hypothetical protein
VAYISGGEKTTMAMLEVLPQARLVVAMARPSVMSEMVTDGRWRALWFDRLPGARNHWQAMAPIMLAAWSTTRIRDADVLISSSHFGAKAAGWGFEGPHLSYCHTPMRIAWRPILRSTAYRAPAG